MKLSEYIEKQIKEHGHVYGEVKSVSESSSTCIVTPDDGGPDIPDVQLTPYLEQEEGVILLPAVGSRVLVAKTGEASGAILMASDLDKYTLNVDGNTLIIDGDISLVRGTSNVTMDGDVNIVNGGSKIVIHSSERIEVSNSVESLKDLLSDLLTALSTTTAAGSPLSSAAQMLTFITRLETLMQ